MQLLPSLQVMSFSRRFVITLCCVMLFLSSCADTTGATPSSAATSVSTSPAHPKSDMNGIETEETLRAQITKVDQIMQGMSLDEKLGQLLMVEFFGSGYQNTELPYMVSQQHVGGFLYQRVNGNFYAPNNTVSSASQIPVQANTDAKIPLLVAIDQEGGQVSKLSDFYGIPPSAAAMTATGDPNTAQAQGVQTAKWMQSLGINTDLAPVVDVGPVANLLEDRQFSDDPKTVATYAGAFLNGLQNNGIIGCLKHFPGLGSLSRATDPHTSLPVVSESMAQLESTDFAPYKMMIQRNHPAMIMSTDVVTTAIDPGLPAELSPKAINGVLRKELGYNGVVITDGLYMGGIQQRWSIAQAAVLAIIAGNDMVEGPFHPSQVADVVVALKDAIQQGQLSIDYVNQAVQRILLMKVQYGIVK
ncbi:MAG: beta-N-acetylhexosaminidase [Ktedonobacteraceae bacterium]